MNNFLFSRSEKIKTAKYILLFYYYIVLFSISQIRRTSISTCEGVQKASNARVEKTP